MTMKLVDTEQLEADLTSVADKIRAKTGGEEKLAFPSGFESALDTIESADSAYKEIEYVLSSGYKYYDYYFTQKRFTTIPMKLIRFIENAVYASRICENCKYLVEFPSVFLPKNEQFAGCFYGCTQLEKVGKIDAPLVTSYYQCFMGCTKLHTIEGIDFSSCVSFGYVFHNCTALENLTFNGVIKLTGLDLSTCKSLSHDSLMSVINALYDYASEGTTGTFKLIIGSTNRDKLTSEEQAIPLAKGWTLQ